MTPTYHLFTLVLCLIGVTGLANAFIAQNDRNMKFIAFVFSVLILSIVVLRVLNAFGVVDILAGGWQEFSRVLWIMALGGLVSILGVPVVLRLLENRHDNKT